MIDNNNNFDRITPYIFGITRLGDDKIPQKERIEVISSVNNSSV